MMHTVCAEDVASGLRVGALAFRVFDDLETISTARRACKQGRILLDGEPVRTVWRAREGQELELRPDPRRHPPNTLFPQVVYADEALAVVVKPAGILTNGNRHRTLERGLPNVLPAINGREAHPVHRLDYETMGLVICTRTAAATRAMGAAFEARTVHKTYQAIVAGRLEGEGVIDEPLDGRDARSCWRVTGWIRSLKITWCTQVEVQPETGRMHQIRRHLASLGHGILGDSRYRTGPLYRGNGLFLAAVGLRFEHPITGAPLSFRIDPPLKYSSFQRREDKRWNRWKGHDMVQPENPDALDR